MALFTDGNVISLDELSQYESSLVQISSTHNIDVSAKVKLTLSIVGDRLLAWLLQNPGSDPQSVTRRVLGLSTVVVTAPVERWLCFDALARFFEEAYNLQLNTRFQGKWTEYKNLAEDAAEALFQTGVGIVYNPLPQPSLPSVLLASGTGMAGSIFLQTSWVDGSGVEGQLSPVNGLILSGTTGLQVTVAANTGTVPPTAIGWNMYASTAAGNLTRQNNAPLAVSGSWQLPASGLIAGPSPSGGQRPNAYVRLAKRIQRG